MRMRVVLIDVRINMLGESKVFVNISEIDVVRVRNNRELLVTLPFQNFFTSRRVIIACGNLAVKILCLGHVHRWVLQQVR